MIRLSKDQRDTLISALASGYSYEALLQTVSVQLGMSSQMASAARSHQVRVEELVDWVEREDKLADLLTIALQVNSRNTQLRMLSEALGLVPATTHVVSALQGLVDPATWLDQLGEVQAQVCCVVEGEPGRGARSTGVLIGPDQILTMNPTAHVPSRRGSVSFDANGSQQGSYALAPEPLIFAASPFRILRLERAAGREIAIGGGAQRGRGWATLSHDIDLPAGGALTIVQYLPDGTRTVAVSRDGSLGAKAADQVEYLVSTHLGSGGAPVFDLQWNLAAMHLGHRNEPGGPNFGVPIKHIWKELHQAGFSWSPSNGVERAAATTYSTPSLDGVLGGVETATDQADADADAWEPELLAGATLEDCWAWAEAAAVFTTYAPQPLKPSKSAADAGRTALLLDSHQQPQADGTTRWRIGDRVRRRALERLAARGELSKVRRQNEPPPNDALDAMLGRALEGGATASPTTRDVDELRNLRQVVVWLHGLVKPLPSLDDVQAALERAAALEPFRHLAKGIFAGRDNELARLRDYVESSDPAPPLFVHGPGGSGKSALLAHFVLAHSERDPLANAAWRPFIYLDFDRADLDATDPLTILRAIARQVTPQAAHLKGAADAYAETFRPQRSTIRRQLRTSKAGNATLRTVSPEAIAGLAKLLSELQSGPGGLPLILDTLEEVQYTNPDAIAPLLTLLSSLCQKASGVRAILAGRIELDLPPKQVESLGLGPLPPAAAETLAENALGPELCRAQPTLVADLVRRVGGNPLSLKLSAEVLRREYTDDPAKPLQLDEGLWQKVNSTVLQGRLYKRILGHIHDERVKALAYPGLLLRRISADVIRAVLAGPCGVTFESPDDAEKVFAELAREVALVKQSGDAGALSVRPELRRAVLEDLKNDVKTADTQRAIHQAAIDYYFTGKVAGLDELGARAEELYHRLMLGEDVSSVDRRWLAGVEVSLRNALPELEGAARTYVANRTGVVDDAAIADGASAEEFEAWAERRATAQLRLGFPDKALEVLRTRAARLPSSGLHLLESVALRSLEPPRLGDAEAAAERAVEAARHSTDGRNLHEALDELLRVRRLNNDDAGVLRALAELGKLGEQLGDDLILLDAQVQNLESAGAATSSKELSTTAIRVFGRLPDELVARAPELARRVAAQVGGHDPATLQRVIRLVGVGELASEAADNLNRALQAWQSEDPGIATFLPKPGAVAQEIASAAEYLINSRSLGTSTATALAESLQSFVTPVFGRGAK